MQKNENKKLKKKLLKELLEALDPLLMCGDDILQVKLYLDQMLIETLKHADDDEMDNFTARELAPTFMALSETLINLHRIPEIADMNSTDCSKLLS